jgi:hypothetical protein
MRAVFAGDGFSLLSHENVHRIAHNDKPVGRQKLTDSLNSYARSACEEKSL